MSARPTLAHHDTWSLALASLVLGFVCYALPLSALAEKDSHSLHIQGSNTIGAKLAPALIQGLFEDMQLLNIRLQAGPAENEQYISAIAANGEHFHASVAAHGSSTGFNALLNHQADLAASSRPIKDQEALALRILGDFRSPAAEQVIALDGVAVVVHPSNPLGQMSTSQLAQVFSGEISDWAQLGAAQGTIQIYARDEQSGTYDTFKELVLTNHSKTLSSQAKRFESSNQLSDAVSQDPNGIGFIGLPYVRQAKALAIADGASEAMPASANLIATEDYPLSRRLFFYINPSHQNRLATALVEFAHSERGQAIAAEQGFVGQKIKALSVTPANSMPETYQQLAQAAKRLSVNFRFSEGSAQLDSKALRDMQRLLAYLKQHDKTMHQVVLVGFGDEKDDVERAELLSKLRAMAVRRELAREDVTPREIIGLGHLNPVANNALDDGRIRNRRVEVWVY